MLNENIKAIRKSKGLSQQDCHQATDTLCADSFKGKQGLSVTSIPICSISLSGNALQTPVSTLLGRNC